MTDELLNLTESMQLIPDKVLYFIEKIIQIKIL